jgi:hypothetical protein
MTQCGVAYDKLSLVLGKNPTSPVHDMALGHDDVSGIDAFVRSLAVLAIEETAGMCSVLDIYSDCNCSVHLFTMQMSS